MNSLSPDNIDECGKVHDPIFFIQMKTTATVKLATCAPEQICGQQEKKKEDSCEHGNEP
jgi:hypothetical protein